MEVNDFIAKLKANCTTEEFCDLKSIQEEYSTIYKKLDSKYRGQFSLNVLCMICRNLDKAPNWKERIDNKVLVVMSIDCARQAKGLTKEENVKVLACLYHLHKHAITQKISSELVLQLSHLPFEVDEKNLLKDYHKTYWAIVVDRLTFIERYKAMKANISKLLPVLINDIIKVISIYNTTQFFQDILLFLFKKLFYLYNDVSCAELEKAYEKLFVCLSKFETIKITKVNCYKLFKIFNECVKICIDNSIKDGFSNSMLQCCIQFGCKVFASYSDVLNSITNIYENVFKNMFQEKPDVKFLELKLNEAFNYLENKDQAAIIIIPYTNHILRLYLETTTEKMNEKSFKEIFPIHLQEIYLKFILLLMKNMGKTEQLLKCDNCKCKMGLHDSLRLSFAVRQFVTTSIKHKINISPILDLVYKTFELQNKILVMLEQNKCINIEKYEFKSQSNAHNLAILLDENKYFDLSLKLFELYLKNELKVKNEFELKSVTRGFYNKSICELDAKKFDSALMDAFLSLIFSFMDKGLRSQKYMSLIIDIKSKWPSERDSDMISLSVVNACGKYIEEPNYGCLKHVFAKLDFVELLKHEYSMYEQLWPSTVPISGVWNSFMDLLNGTYDWLTVDSEDKVLLELSKIIFVSVNVVRTIHYEGFVRVITELVDKLRHKKKNNLTYNIIYATLLVLKSEFKMAECSQKYDWKSSDKNNDAENISVTRNLCQEHESLQYCFESFDEWMQILPDVIKDDKQSMWIDVCLPLTQLTVHTFLQSGHLAYALQMAYMCTQLALFVNNINIYALNVGILMYNTKTKSEPIETLYSAISKNLPGLMGTGCKDTLLTCICESAIYFTTIGNKILAANLLNYVLIHVAEDFVNNTNNYVMSIGRLLEAQLLLHDNTNKMSRLSTIQKHWFGKLNKTSWLTYTQKNLQMKYNGVLSTLNLASLCSNLYLWRRARSTVFVAGIMGASALCRLFLAISNVHKPDDTQINIENRLKYILYSTNGNKIVKTEQAKIKNEKIEIQDNINKVEAVEIMMEAKHLSNHDKSPLTITAIPAFKLPNFMLHEKNCKCYICGNPLHSIVALGIVKLETFMYFRNDEFEIAKNYFDGVIKMVTNTEMRINNFIEQLKVNKFEDFIVGIVKDNLVLELKKVQIEILIENAFFELSQSNKENADDIIVLIQEFIDNFKNIDIYIKDSFMNLLATVYKIKEKAPEIKISDETSLENEFDNLKLSPNNKTEKELQKTPENRPKKPPKDADNVKIYTDDEIPKINKKIKKLNLDSTSPEEKVTKVKNNKLEEFKIPVPKIAKPQPEIVTPRTTRSRPKVIVSQPILNDFVTPKKQTQKSNETLEFFTPLNKIDTVNSTFNTPANNDEFFTPVSNIKTYTTKKQIRNQIVKNLEDTFATPLATKSDIIIKDDKSKTVKINKVETGCLKTMKDKRNLRRATSPGKLASEVKKVEAKVVVKKTVRNKLPFSPEEDLTKKINLRFKKN